MIVYTYFEPIRQIEHANENRLATLWRRSWARSGFIPMILNSQHAESHPRYAEYRSLVEKFPTTNAPGYDLACWLRWLALDVVGGGLMTDHDVICRAFDPEHLSTPDPILVLDATWVPCAVRTTPGGSNQLINDILTHPHRPPARHYSDMFYFREKQYPKDGDLTRPYGTPGWTEAPAVHFSHHDCGLTSPRVDRADLIYQLMFGGNP